MTKFSIYYEPDGYSAESSRIMGRHSAGNGFLRASINDADTSGEPIVACVPGETAARQFVHQVAQLSTKARVQIESVESLCQPGRSHGLYVPGPGIAKFSSLRMRGRVDSFSIVGVTHTIASHAALTSISELAGSSLMPWDALICTSNAVRDAVSELLNSQLDFLRWRLGSKVEVELPQFPLIPLGIHASDFDFPHDERMIARAKLSIASDEVVILFVGRLSFHAKAHPFPMFQGAEAVSKRTGKKIVLLMCGWFANESIEKAFVEGAARYFPRGRTLFVNGADGNLRSASWVAADVFVSLSDNLQESFGLTPLEAMAAGLPVIVTDWDGYRDTVRDGVDGYRVPVSESLSAIGQSISQKYEAGIINYDMYCGLTCMMIAPDADFFQNCLASLVENTELRISMGQSGRKHVRENLDWRIIHRRYQELFLELEKIREARGALWQRSRPQTLCSLPDKLPPEKIFSSFATKRASVDDMIRVTKGEQSGLIERFRELSRDPLFSFAAKVLPAIATVRWILDGDGKTLAQLSASSGVSSMELLAGTAILKKMGLVSTISPDDQGR